MKKIIIVLFASAFFICADRAIAQIGIGIGTNGFGIGMNVPVNGRKAQKSKHLDKQVDQLKRDLDLNDEQVVKVRSLLIERDRSHNRTGKKEMTGEQFNLRMQEILTDEQNIMYAKLRQQKREEKKDMKPGKEKESTPPDEWDDVYK